eukprot:TRINITY_DN2857_c0_g1_i1.p1 TRINITY_DN2857_c0_g1~~TRINITY_DN2857_c0_g1_i1.p1  ORF type:complete len:212 (-),score=35.15 TRINITY_DN2857_c0_g1_i1:121-756(-)
MGGMGFTQFSAVLNTRLHLPLTLILMPFTQSHTKISNTAVTVLRSSSQSKTSHRKSANHVLPCFSHSKNVAITEKISGRKSCVIAEISFISTHWNWIHPSTAEVAAAEEIEAAAPQAEVVPESVPLPPPDTIQSRFVSLLLFLAFIALTVLTIGVVYLAVTEFLENRQRKKLLSEQESKAKSKIKEKGKKVKAAKTGPRGFGQSLRAEDKE